MESSRTRVVGFLGIAWTVVSLTTASIAQTASHRWAGLVHDAFTFDGVQVFTAEDGARVRARDVNGSWTFQQTPADLASDLANA